MPRRAKELSAIEVRRLGCGVHNVGGVAGLLIQVSDSGAQSWLLRVRVGDKRREIGLGAYPEVSLARAREKAAEAKEAIRNGIDPVETRKAARGLSNQVTVTLQPKTTGWLVGFESEKSMRTKGGRTSSDVAVLTGDLTCNQLKP